MIMISCFSMRCHAESNRDVTDLAAHEIERRGNHVEQTGTVRANLIGDAFAPPKDDSDKWFLTLISKDRDKTSADLAAMIANSPHLRCWVNTADSQKSTMHYQHRIWDLEGTQRDWLFAVKDLVQTHGLPCIVIQPPINGKFGKPSTVVKVIHGIRDARELSDTIRDGIIEYVKTLSDPSRGVRASEQLPPAGVAPPFNVVPPVNQPNLPPNALPFEFPPSSPRLLTMSQIREACPGATAEFVIEQLDAKATSVEMVQLRWELYQSKQKPPPIPEPPPRVLELTPRPAPIVEPEPMIEPEIVRPRALPPFEPAFPVPTMEPLVIASCVGFALGMLCLWLIQLATKSIGQIVAALRTLRTIQTMPTSPTNGSTMVQPSGTMSGNGGATMSAPNISGVSMPPVPSVNGYTPNG
jgi:hypothetical protein